MTSTVSYPRSGGGTGAVASDEDPAVAAALTYTEASQGWLYLDDEQVATAVAEIATPEAAEQIAAEVVSEVATAREQLSAADGAVWWIVRPLAWRQDEVAERAARVDVWAVTILSAGDIATPQTEYVTITLDLALVSGRWLVDAARDRPGPTPITGPHDQPWESQEFTEALAGFTRIAAGPQR